MIERVRERGGSDEDLYRLNTPDGKPIIAKLADAIVASGNKHINIGYEQKPARCPHSSDAIASSHGFTVVEDVTPSEFKVADLELVPFLKPEDGGRIGGETLRTRAVTLKANLGLMDAKRLLDNQSEIPTEFRGSVLVFTGTLLRGSDDNLCVAFLYWCGDGWHLLFDWLDDDWDDDDRLLRCK